VIGHRDSFKLSREVLHHLFRALDAAGTPHRAHFDDGCQGGF
jgi:hypothetical protein